MPKPLKTPRVLPPIAGGGQRGQALRTGLYARVSTYDQKTLPMQLAAMRDNAKKRSWAVAVEVQDVGSGATTRPQREKLIEAARRREIDLVLVWRNDQIVTRYMADKEFQASAYPILAREIFDDVRSKCGD